MMKQAAPGAKLLLVGTQKDWDPVRPACAHAGYKTHSKNSWIQQLDVMHASRPLHASRPSPSAFTTASRAPGVPTHRVGT